MGHSNARSLFDSLCYEPRPLKFGTSGRRGEVVHLTQLEIYINVLAEIEYLQTLPQSEGGILPGDDFYFAYDLRPSSTRRDLEQGGRGEIAQAVERAVRDAGMQPVNLGPIPTPALTLYALTRGKGSIMVTGSHIPFARNGYKTNTALGELLKKDEDPINERSKIVRERLYGQAAADSPFDPTGSFKTGPKELSIENPAGRRTYIQRYLEFFGEGILRGLKLMAYQHSAVGRDIMVEILEGLGAEVFPMGRSESFVPIDTENIDDDQLARIQDLADECGRQWGPFDAVVSTDGDSDRPLFLGIEPANPCRVRFYGGDLVGMIAAEHLGADSVVVPISCNDGVDRGSLAGIVETKTRIGSPYVIEGMEKARRRGRQAVCGWEANGGFLAGSDLRVADRVLNALPTRDAMLPILACLAEMQKRQIPATRLFDLLPKRFSRASLLKSFPREKSQRIMAAFTLPQAGIADVFFEGGKILMFDPEGCSLPGNLRLEAVMLSIRQSIGKFFGREDGFPGIARVNYTDGIRLYFENGEVAHIRPSGNADELRIYAVADTQNRADEIVRKGVSEPSGILRRLEQEMTSNSCSPSSDF